jgi:broad specificity phosphatase PhoE
MNEVIDEILTNNKDKRIAIFSHGYAICFYLLQFAKLEHIDLEKNITIKYKNNILLDGRINAPEIFKVEYDNKELISINNITTKELRK